MGGQKTFVFKGECTFLLFLHTEVLKPSLCKTCFIYEHCEWVRWIWSYQSCCHSVTLQHSFVSSSIWLQTSAWATCRLNRYPSFEMNYSSASVVELSPETVITSSVMETSTAVAEKRPPLVGLKFPLNYLQLTVFVWSKRFLFSKFDRNNL